MQDAHNPALLHFKSITYSGQNPGPRLLISGAVHGNETCGTQAIRRALHDIDSGKLHIVDGQLQLGRKPGLGLELNRKTLDRLRLADPYHVPDGFYSDMVFGKEWLRPAGAYRENPPAATRRSTSTR